MTRQKNCPLTTSPEPERLFGIFSTLCYAAIFNRQSSRAVTPPRPVYFGTEATPLSFSERRKKENGNMDIAVLIEMFQLHFPF
jgi:hypothetical protein